MPSPKLKNLTDWFDRVYLINCAHRPDRLAEVTAHLAKSRMADLSKVIIQPAVVGDWANPPARWGAGRGAWGCLRSHSRILEECLHVRDDRGHPGLDNALILEDDVFFLPGALKALNEFMREIPADWGQIYLGGQHRRPTTPTGNPHVLKAGSVNRTHAYAVNRESFQPLYQHINYAPDYAGTSKHLDHQLEVAHQRGDWPVYCPVKWICGQEAGTSNISGKNLPRSTWEWASAGTPELNPKAGPKS
jgi:GR25 family glycosyltransferase involved in LPS biosynthesis